jgi:hypothetical protein
VTEKNKENKKKLGGNQGKQGKSARPAGEIILRVVSFDSF